LPGAVRDLHYTQVLTSPVANASTAHSSTKGKTSIAEAMKTVKHAEPPLLASAAIGQFAHVPIEVLSPPNLAPVDQNLPQYLKRIRLQPTAFIGVVPVATRPYSAAHAVGNIAEKVHAQTGFAATYTVDKFSTGAPIASSSGHSSQNAYPGMGVFSEQLWHYSLMLCSD
jgi:hypothetical protein